MNQTELIGVFCARPQSFAWLLGAGASHSTGLPTASDLLWYMKRTYYCDHESQDVSRQDLQNPAVRARIQSFMLSRGFPEEWSEGEYPKYFEKIFADDRERQATYVRRRLSEENVTLNVGQRAFGGLLATGRCRVAFTTNFDTVIEKSVAEVSGKAIAPFHLEGARAANAALNNEEYPIVCKLHGDFRYDSIKNLPKDLAVQNADLSACLVNAAARFGFIVTGYSGRDASVVALLRKALEQPNPFPHGFYWTHMKGAEPIAPVTALIADAQAKGVRAEVVQIETFDSLLLRIWRSLDRHPPAINANVKKAKLVSAAIPTGERGQELPLIRMNALPVLSLPESCLELSFKAPMQWLDLRAAQQKSESRAILTISDSVLGWGSTDELRATFGDQLISTSVRHLPDDVSSPQNLNVKALMEEAVCVAIARERPLLARSQRSHAALITDLHTEDIGDLAPLTALVGKIGGTIPGLFTEVTEEHPEPQQVAWSECVRVSLTQKNGATWLLLDPDVWIWPTRARRIADDFLDRRRADRFNNRFNGLLDAWIEVIFATSERNIAATFLAFEGDSSASNPAFMIGNRTAYAKKLAV